MRILFSRIHLGEVCLLGDNVALGLCSRRGRTTRLCSLVCTFDLFLSGLVLGRLFVFVSFLTCALFLLLFVLIIDYLGLLLAIGALLGLLLLLGGRT